MKAVRIVERLTALFGIAGCVLVCAPAKAQDTIPDNPVLRDRFFFAAGGYLPTTSTDVRLDSTTRGAGAAVNFEDTLGLEESKLSAEYLARFRFAERWRIEMEHFRLTRSGSRILRESLQVGEKMYSVNERLQSAFDIAVTRVSAGYSFFKTRDKELGVAIGAHVASIRTSIDGSVSGTEGRPRHRAPAGAEFVQPVCADRHLGRRRQARPLCAESRRLQRTDWQPRR